jgi:hypothetical protein
MIAALLALAGHVSGHDGAQAARQDVLNGFAALDKPIGIAEYAVPARTLCADLGKLSGVRLSCDGPITEDLVVLVVKPRPAREILEKVATTFGWRWLPDGSGLRLSPTEAFSHLAATGRYEILAAEAARRQQAAKDLIAQMHSQNVAALQKEMQALQAKIQAGMQGGVADPDAWREQTDRQAQILQRFNPATTVALAAFAELDVEQAVRLYDHRLIVGSSPRPLEVAMGRRAETEFETCIPSLQKAPEPAADSGVMYTPLWGFGEVTGADVELDAWDHAGVVLRSESGPEVDWAQVSLPSPKPLPLPPLATALRTALSNDTTNDNELPPSTSPDGGDPLSFYGRWLAGVARRLDCDVVSDAYDTYQTFSDVQRFESKLPGFRGAGFEPVLDGGWLTVRNRQWPRYREEQAPRDLLRQLDAPIDVLPLDERAAIASRFTVPQLKSPLVGISPNDYWFFRFWNSLSPPLRDSLRAGKKMRLVDLPESAIDYLYEVGEQPVDTKLRSASFSWGGSGAFSEPDFVDYQQILNRIRPQDDPNGSDGFSLEWPPRNHDFGRIYPSGTDPSASVWMQVADVTGLMDSDSRQFFAPGDLAGGFSSDAPATHPTAVPDVKHLKLTHSRAYRLHIGIGDGFEIQADAQETTVGDDIANDPGKWPKDLRDRIQKRIDLQRMFSGVFIPQTPPP